MARTYATWCELRTLPEFIKAYCHGRITSIMGRCGKPVSKRLLIPAADAFTKARKFKKRFGTTIS